MRRFLTTFRAALRFERGILSICELSFLYSVALNLRTLVWTAFFTTPYSDFATFLRFLESLVAAFLRRTFSFMICLVTTFTPG